MKKWILIISILLLFSVEILQVYFIMPFPGSQKSNTIGYAYFLHKNIWLLRLIFLMLIAFALFRNFSIWKKWKKITLFFFISLYLTVFFFVNFKFLADKMFYPPKNKVMLDITENKVNTGKLVVGIVINQEARAYPIEIIGYHHQVLDTVGGQPVMVTYCSVCRTGRVFSPIINEKKETFRLVGMDHFNAMFEDATTKSWWRQANGEAIIGPLKGKKLEEIPSEQMTLSSWLRNYPNTLILQPDSVFKKNYEDLKGFDDGTIASSLEKRDSSSWQFKSWIVGIEYKGFAKAYDWNEIVRQRIIQDSLPNLPLLIFLESDQATFRVWNRQVNNLTLEFYFGNNVLKDTITQSIWNVDGICIDGQLKGSSLKKVQAYQEFWHSWKSFHPNTSVYNKKVL